MKNYLALLTKRGSKGRVKMEERRGKSEESDGSEEGREGERWERG